MFINKLYILQFIYILIICAAILFHVWNEVLFYSRKITRSIRDCKAILTNYVPKTGDLIFTQFKSHGLSKYISTKGSPTHAGIVWVKNEEALLIENTIFNDSLQDYFYGRDRITCINGGVRVVKLSEFIPIIDGYVSVRCLKKGAINEHKIEEILEDWAFSINFDTNMSNNMGLATSLGFAVRPIFRNFSNILFYNLKHQRLNAKQKQTFFCTEFLVQFLQRLGHVDASFHDYWQITPFCMTSQVGIIDELSQHSTNPIYWDKDQVLLCP
jgi:hypothetical protein